MQLDDQLLQPLRQRHDEIAERRDALHEELYALNAEITAINKVLKVANSFNGATPEKKKEKKQHPPPSAEIQQRVLDFVARNTTADAKTTGEALGISPSYAGKTLSYLRDMEQIRLVRWDAASADGRGRKPVYGPWIGDS